MLYAYTRNLPSIPLMIQQALFHPIYEKMLFVIMNLAYLKVGFTTFRVFILQNSIIQYINFILFHPLVEYGVMFIWT